MRALKAVAVALAAVLCLGAAAASDPAERLPDPAKEARARSLFREIRCLVCQNESIDESEAELAADLRRIVRDQIVQGRSDAQVRTFLTDRYGEFVLLKPKFSPGNAMLWLGPFAVILLGGAAALVLRRKDEGVAPLSQDEESRLAALAAELDTIPPHGGHNKTFARETKGS